LILDYELALPLGAIAFYLYDSALLLYRNELVLERTARAWRMARTADVRLFGRRLFLPNPLNPQTPLFRVSWSEADTRGKAESAENLNRFVTALRPLRVLAVLLLLLLGVALPVVSVKAGLGGMMLGVFAAYYLTTLIALVVIHARRGQLDLTRRAFWSLAFDVIACPPFAANIVRKLSLRRSIAGDPLLFAAEAMSKAALCTTLGQVRSQAREELEGEPAGSPRHAELESFCTRLDALI
jgi:hypothetical protein